MTQPVTVAEATDHRATSRHADVLSFIAALAHVAFYLLEPESDDGLVEWGFFPTLRPGDIYPVRRISSAMLES